MNQNTNVLEVPPTPENSERRPAEAVQTASKDMIASAKEAYGAADEFLAQTAAEKPYVLLGAAAGLGFVLAGGLASRLTIGIAGVAGRLVAVQMVEQLGQSRSR